MDLNLVEIFWSVQGEGLCVGLPSVFIRLGECDLRCSWCDSPGTWRPSAICRVEKEPGGGRFREVSNPIEAETVATWVEGLAQHRSTWISLTGGEPLLQPEALEAVVDALVARGRRIYLETHGLHAEALARVADRIDLISMDWKLSSEVRWAPRAEAAVAGDFHEAHQRFLRVALAAKSVYVKLVLTPSTTQDEFDAMLDRIGAVSPDIPLVLQPVTPTGGVKERPDPERLLAWLARAEQRLSDVRLIPQTHPIYGAL
jgi:7-carboxy-7-deazaguanine synthase